LLTVLVALASCLVAFQARAANEGYVDTFSCDEGPFHLDLPKSYLDLRKIGRIRSERIVETEDWGSYKTERKDFEFDGLSLRVITFSNDPTRYMVAIARTTSRNWGITGPFRVGDSLLSALSHFGVRRAPNLLEYGSEGGVVRFKVANGRIVEVRYECYTG
jgi:hypothetical protein